MRFLPILSLLGLLTATAAADPVWIWSSPKAANNEAATFKTTFEVPGEVKAATLTYTCDNGAKAILNGKAVAENPDWMAPTKVDVAKLLKTGSNEIVINATNQGGVAALIARLNIETADGKKLAVETSGAWQTAATKDGKEWKPAHVVAKYGAGPWGLALDGKARSGGSPDVVTAAKDVTVPAGFAVELLYTVPKDEQGSWVAMTVDAKGRLIACDQYGSLYRMAVPAIGKTETLKPEKLPVAIGKAHGLLYAFNSLYVMVNEDGQKNGLYRLQDTKGDGNYDKIDHLVNIKGGGEHGLHNMVVSPDGKRIFFNCGNHTKLPEGLEKSRAARLWDEDHVLPRFWDANGHARGIYAPGGYVCSMDPDGKNVELYASGFRNEFDIAFDANGELFTFDADMEWDIGSPWYRPTRVNHVVSGGEYGWRSGSGKWPAYYPDSLPAVIDIGPGSPTGIVCGTGAKFPARYQRALFINDWTYGTMWAVHMQPKGSSFAAEKEEFVFGKPLPLTDVIIHPQDGAMYFAVGGRKTQSAVYRVTYIGSESTAPVAALPPDEEVSMRRTLEKLHLDGADPQKALATAWSYLNHSDREVRFAARVAIERLPVSLWKDKALNETQPQALIEALVALARASGKRPPADLKAPAGFSTPGVGPVAPEDAEFQGQMFLALARLGKVSLSLDQKLAALRALELIITRLGKPDADTCDKVVAGLDLLYPADNALINRELCQLLVVLDSPTAPVKTLAMMATAQDDSQAIASDAVLSRNEGYASAAREAAGSRPNAQQIAYMVALRNATVGWTPELRKTYFSWFPHARTWKGGNSFKGFIENTRKEALANFAPKDELAALDALSSKVEAVAIPNYLAPKGPGKNWTIDEVVNLTKDGFKGRDFKNGEAMFRSVMCASCHHFNGDGGNIGPDITGIGNRYTMRDLMENIIDPSKVISDQYDSHEIVKKDGTIILGRIIVEENGKVFVMTNPFAPSDQLAINESDIKSKQTRKVSMMPPSLINALNQDELLDLLAYLVTGGNAKDKAFSK